MPEVGSILVMKVNLVHKNFLYCPCTKCMHSHIQWDNQLVCELKSLIIWNLLRVLKDGRSQKLAVINLWCPCYFSESRSSQAGEKGKRYLQCDEVQDLKCPHKVGFNTHYLSSICYSVLYQLRSQFDIG